VPGPPCPGGMPRSLVVQLGSLPYTATDMYARYSTRNARNCTNCGAKKDRCQMGHASVAMLGWCRKSAAVLGLVSADCHNTRRSRTCMSKKALAKLDHFTCKQT
jgi:hypothetical protein